MSKDNRVVVYAAGGCAINIITPLANELSDTQGYAKMEIAAIDTSRSNLLKHYDTSKMPFYFIENRNMEVTDGSGKVRSTNLQAVQQSIPDILAQHRPGDLNIVLHSGSGGSGSVIAPSLVSELLARDQNVIVILVGSSFCMKEQKNTIDTIMSYQAIAQARDRAVPVYYLDNSERSMSHNNDQARLMILFLSMVWSGENHGLDRRDLYNFLNYNKVTSYPVGIVGVGLVGAGDPLPELKRGTLISTMVSIIREGEDPNPNTIVAYHSYGTLPDYMDVAVQIKTPVHLYTIQGHFSDILKELNKRHQEHSESYRINPIETIQVSGSTTSDGLIITD